MNNFITNQRKKIKEQPDRNFRNPSWWETWRKRIIARLIKNFPQDRKTGQTKQRASWKVRNDATERKQRR